MAGEYPDIPYVQAAHFGGPREKTKIVVMHATDNTASDEAEVGYAAHRPDSVSAHFTNDEDSIYQSVPLGNVAYGCLYHDNHMSIQFEQCGKSGHLTDLTMRTSAAAVRRVCQRYGIPMRKLNPAEVRAAWYSGGPGGICGHADVTRAFPEDNGDHLDPGWDDATWARFVGYVSGTASVRGHLGMLILAKAVGDPSVKVGDGFQHRAVKGDGKNLGYLQDAIRAAGGDGVIREYATWDLALDVIGRDDMDAPAPAAGGPAAVADLDALAQKVAALLAPAIVGLARTSIDGATIHAPAAG